MLGEWDNLRRAGDNQLDSPRICQFSKNGQIRNRGENDNQYSPCVGADEVAYDDWHHKQ